MNIGYLGNSLLKMSTQLIYNFEYARYFFLLVMRLREAIWFFRKPFVGLEFMIKAVAERPWKYLGIQSMKMKLNMCTYPTPTRVQMHRQALGQTDIALRHHCGQMCFKVKFYLLKKRKVKFLCHVIGQPRDIAAGGKERHIFFCYGQHTRYPYMYEPRHFHIIWQYSISFRPKANRG